MERVTSTSAVPGALRVATSIVIPAYNEARRMEESLPRLVGSFDGTLDPSTEIIVVDDGSEDDTLETARRHLGSLPQVRFIRLESNRGKGAAVRAGVAAARGSVIAYADADMATDPSAFPRLIAALADCEVAIGSRALPESTVNCRNPKRVLFGRVFNHFVRTATDIPVLDTQCGFKAFRAPAAKLLFHASNVDRYAFDVEILMLARKFGMKVREVPVEWTDVKGSHVRPFLDALPMAFDVVRAATMWRRVRAVQAVTIVSNSNGHRHGPPEVSAALADNLRHSDPVVSWPRGALALLPGLDPDSVSAVRARLSQRLPGCRVAQSAVGVDMLLHPSAAPLMAALRALPRPQPAEAQVVCDQGTASALLSSLGVA